MSLLSWFENALPLKAARLIARLLPPPAGHRLADVLGRISALLPDSKLMRAVRENQWVASGERINRLELRHRSHEVMRQNARCLYDFLYFLDHPDEMMRRFSISPRASACIERIRQNQAVVVATPHLSNFDLAGQLLAHLGLNLQILSYPNPTGGYQYQNRLRENRGVVVTPISPRALSQARERLKAGGCVLTGLDRPIETLSEQKYTPSFFGRPCSLPVLHIRLALALDIPLVVLACYHTDDGQYTLKASDLLTPQHAPDLVSEVVLNAERVLKEAEVFIREAPTQWRMFYPLWPGCLPEDV